MFVCFLVILLLLFFSFTFLPEVQCFRPSRSTPNSSENDHFPVFLSWIVAEGPVQAGFLIYPSCTPYCVLSMGILVISGPSLWIVCVCVCVCFKYVYVCVCMYMYYFKTGVGGENV